MDKTHAPAQCHLAHFGPDEEHVALLANLGRFDVMRRRADFFAEGVTGVYGLVGADAELLPLCFTPENSLLPRQRSGLPCEGSHP